MTMLTLVQEFCRRTGLSVPQIVATSQDEQLLQLQGLLNEVLDDLGVRQQWTSLQREVVFSSVASESQGLLTTLADGGFQWIINDTIFDRTRRLPVFGPRGAEYWQQVKALPFSGPYYQYRILQGELHILPVMPAGHTMAFEYVSNWPVKDATSLTAPYKQWFTADSDTCIYPDALLLTGLRWVWKKEKGLRYAEEFRSYESILANLAGHDGTKPVLSMNGPNQAIQPGIFVPSGSWPV